MRKRLRQLLLRGALGALAWAGLATGVEALTITTTGSGTNTSGETVSASVEFRTSAGKIDIFLTNTTENPKNIAEILTNLEFHVTTGQTSSTVTGFAKTRDVAKDGTFTTSTTNISPTDWTLTPASYTYNSSTVSGMMLTALGPPNGAEQGIIGPPDSSDPVHYTAANSSVADSNPHNPFLWNTTSDTTGTPYPTGTLFPNGAVHFVLTVAGVTSASSVDSIVFSWGSTPGNFLEVPLPGSVLLLGSGLGLMLVRWKRRRRTPPASAP